MKLRSPRDHSPRRPRNSRRSRYNAFAETLESRRLLAAIAWDGNGDGVNWNNANNWNPNQVPTVNDDVSITSTTFNGGTYTVQLNGATGNARTLTLGGASGQQTLQVNSVLNLGPVLISAVNANGELRVAGQVTGSGLLNNSGIMRLSSAA